MKEDHQRDAAFSKVMHGKSVEEKSAFMAMLKKDSGSQGAAADAYFKHWDNKDAKIETEKDRLVSVLSLVTSSILFYKQCCLILDYRNVKKTMPT